ncbi:unnamed protein product [Mytilus coruscus]|uniref:TIR domain-containing protein n=1 Tax=Mytilus coruscus TaxID=42192 RepID=A0A6J8AKC7_MYTCO|nr:unnamed protein product [Mytilus coruscus]
METITNTSFSNLPFLRHVDLSKNKISHIDPGSLAYRPRSLLYINLSFNNLEELDVSNFMLDFYFYRLDFSNNQISKLTNKNGWNGFNIDDRNGGGRIVLMNNKFTHFPNVSKIGFAGEYSVKRLAYTYIVNMRNNNWTCDCYVWNEYLNYMLVGFQYHPGSENFYRIPCSNPPELRNYFVTDFQKNETNKLQHLLICNLTLIDNCPYRCYCFYQPSKNRTVIDCSGLALKEERSYLFRATKLNVSNNFITTISPIIYEVQILNLIDFRLNSLNTLGNEVRLKSPCSLLFSHLTISCSCELNWLPIWLERQKLPYCMFNRIVCISNNKDVSSMSPSEFCIQDNTTKHIFTGIVITSFLVIIITTIIFHHYKYEIYLLWRSNKLLKSSRKVHSETKYDIYISFDEENEMARQWIVGVLLRFLEGKGYKVLLPCRDFSFGGIREEEMRSSIWKCSSWIILQSQNYLHSTYGENEWKIIWNIYKTNLKTKNIIINYDVIKSDSISLRNFRAFIKLGYALDFCNIDKNLLNDVRKRLGPPASRYTTGLKNSKLRYKHMEKFDIFVPEKNNV